MTTPSLKVCYKCSEELPLAEFHRRRGAKDGHYNQCKACANADRRNYRAAKVDYYREYDRKRIMAPHRVEQMENYRRKSPQKHKARAALRNAVYLGKLKKPDCCQKCGEAGIIHGHHHDYSKPLDVMWLCPKCHAAEHMEMAS